MSDAAPQTDSPEYKGPFEEQREELSDVENTDEQETTTTTSGDELDWSAVWDEFNFREDSCISRTQLAAAIRATDKTGGLTEGAVHRLASEALEAGLLTQVKRKAHTNGEGTALVLAGYKLRVDE